MTSSSGREGEYVEWNVEQSRPFLDIIKRKDAELTALRTRVEALEGALREIGNWPRYADGSLTGADASSMRAIANTALTSNQEEGA